MDRKINGHNADYLKRKARSLSKSSGITHTEALNLVVKDLGFANWENYKKVVEGSQVTFRKPKAPEPSVLNYHDFRTGAIIGQHPNKKMTIRRHSRVGALLQELLEEVEYHKRAKSIIQDIRIIMDNWLGAEYSQAELANTEFNEIYYGKSSYSEWQMPDKKRQAQIKRSLRQVRAIIDRNYHDCKPLDKLHERFDLALKVLEKWPKTIKGPKLNRLAIPLSAGTFVRLDHNKQIGLVFRHDTRKQIVEGYSDAGRFMVGRHEVSILRKQLPFTDFKPMRLYLPYGKWTCADGREVLFNRDYCPIWEKSTDGIVATIQPDAYVKHETREYYYNDGTSPYRGNKETLESCLNVLKEWGVAEKPNLLLEMLPAALAAGDVRILSPKGMS